MEKNLHFPVKNYYAEGTNATVDSRVSLVDRGVDPKPLVLEFCKPMCTYWKEKLERCEHKLATIIKVSSLSLLALPSIPLVPHRFPSSLLSCRSTRRRHACTR